MCDKNGHTYSSQTKRAIVCDEDREISSTFSPLCGDSVSVSTNRTNCYSVNRMMKLRASSSELLLLHSHN